MIQRKVLLEMGCWLGEAVAFRCWSRGTKWRGARLALMSRALTIMRMMRMGCTQIPISTLSHIWVFVRLYGIVYVIIVIIIIIIMII